VGEPRPSTSWGGLLPGKGGYGFPGGEESTTRRPGCSLIVFNMMAAISSYPARAPTKSPTHAAASRSVKLTDHRRGKVADFDRRYPRALDLTRDYFIGPSITADLAHR
jgi:hypothetical protein